MQTFFKKGFFKKKYYRKSACKTNKKVHIKKIGTHCVHVASQEKHEHRVFITQGVY